MLTLTQSIQQASELTSRQVHTALVDSTANFKEKNIGENIPKIKILFHIKGIKQFG